MKQLITGVILGAVGTTAAFLFSGETSPHLSNGVQAQQPVPTLFNIEGPLEDYHFRLAYYGPFYDGMVWPPESDPDDTLHFAAREKLMNIAPEIIEHVCFTNTEAEGDKYYSIGIDLHLTDEGRKQLLDAAKAAKDREMVMYYYDQLVFNFMPTSRSIERTEERFAEESNGSIAKSPELSLSTSGAGRMAILRYASVLSPDVVPTGCTTEFQESEIPGWSAATERVWGEVY